MQIDSNTDGLVDFTEFVAAALHVHQLEEHNSEKWQLRSQAAFEKFDIDRDGYITPEELRMVLIFLCIEYPALLYLFFMRN
jgi:calcium-dependent protein kinase